MKNCKILIIGAGVTGLSCAAQNKDDEYFIIESSNSIGGYCKTTHRNGFVWDYSGHFFHFTDPTIEQWLCQNIPHDDLITVAKQTKIYYKNKLIDYPFQKNIHQLPKQEFIECLYDLFVNPYTEYDSFQTMLYAKFGKSIAEKFLIPYNQKLYACDLNNLDKDAMGRFFPFADKEDIIKNFKQSNNDTYNATFVYPKNGAIEYINSIAKHVNTEKILLNSTVVDIDKDAHIATLADGKNIKYDVLVSTIPFPQLLKLCHISYDTTIYNCNKVLVFNLGFDSLGSDKDNHWIYFPEKQYCFYRVGFYSNILHQDRMSLYVELGFPITQSIQINGLLNTVLQDLQKANIVNERQKLVDYESILMNPAYVHINEVATKDIQQKKQLLQSYNVFSIGRYGSWTYCSIEDNIKEAKYLIETL